MSRGNEHANAKSIREHNAATFQKYKKKLVDANLQSDPVKWVRLAHTLVEFVCDARIYYDEARPDIVDCVEIATGAVQNTVPGELRHLRPITLSHLPEAYRPAYDELKRLLVVVGSYQPEMLRPPKGGDARPDLLSRITSCIAAFGIDPDSLLDKTSLEAAMQSVVLDEKYRQIIAKSIAKRKPDAVSVVSSTRSTPSLATPVLSAASPHTTASPQVSAPITPTAYSGPTPIPMHVAAPHAPLQMLTQPTLPSSTTPTGLVPPVRPNIGVSKPRKQPKWMAQDLDKFRKEKEKMANSVHATVTPTPQPPMSPVVSQQPIPTQVQRLAGPPIPVATQSPVTQVISTPTTTTMSPAAPAPALNDRGPAADHQPSAAPTNLRHTQAADIRQLEGAEIDTKASEGMDVDTPLLDEPTPLDDKPLPYTLPPQPYPHPSTPTWSELFAEAINAAHEHKLSIGEMIRYVSTVYPTLKGTKNAASAMFHSKMAKQTGKSSTLSGTVMDDFHATRHVSHKAPRFVRTADVYPVTWTLENPEESRSEAPNTDAAETEAAGTGETSPDSIKQEQVEAPAEDAPTPATTPSLPYALPPGPYTPIKPSKALPVLVQEAILAGTPDKALSQPDIISYIRTVYPFYASTPDLEAEVTTSLQQHFAPKDDGRWSLWIHDGSDEDRPVPYTLPPGPRSSTKPNKPLLDLIREAISASNGGHLTQRDVAAYVLSVAPYYNCSDEPLPFGQLLQEHFAECGSDAEGRTLWGAKDEAPVTEPRPVDAVPGDGPMVTEDAVPIQDPARPKAAQSDGRSSSRPPKYKGPPKSAAVIDSDEESDLETPITPSTADVPPTVQSSVTQGLPPQPRSSSASRLFVLPPGPYTSHKPPKTNEAVVLEAFRASVTGQLRKKEIVLYIQTVYPWFRRDERATLSCKKMVENSLTRLKGAAITRIGTGLYRFNSMENVAGPSIMNGRGVTRDEDMDDIARPSAPKSTHPDPSPVLKIRIPARQVSGDASAPAHNKRSAPSPSPARSESPAMPKRIKLKLPDRPGVATNSDTLEASSSATSADNAPRPKTNGIHPSEPDVAVAKTTAPSVEERPDVEMQDGSEVAEVPAPPPLPPVSFGQDACLVDVAFGRPTTASFTLHVNPRPEQWAMVENWRNAARNDEDVSEALCYSMACYRSEDVHSLKDDVVIDIWGNTLVRGEIPVSLHNPALHSLCLTGNGRTVPFPLTWMSATASPLFLDISPYLVPGDNVLTLAHTIDLSAFTFAIVAHRPNPHQLRWLDVRRGPRRRLHAQISNAMHVPQTDFGALLISSKDVSKVDLERGVPQELFTLS
ncbi:unnamed protein product [Peniophora sp. CBMAI 1063]|nr:unnamed protein product [Peniophora sp. CBMAI 1063]